MRGARCVKLFELNDAIAIHCYRCLLLGRHFTWPPDVFSRLTAQLNNSLLQLIANLLCNDWQRSSVVRMSVFGQRTFSALHPILLTGDHFVCELSLVGQPARPTQPSIHSGSAMYGFRPKSVNAGLGYGLGCAPALSVTTAPLRPHMWQLWRYISELFRYLYLFLFSAYIVVFSESFCTLRLFVRSAGDLKHVSEVVSARLCPARRLLTEQRSLNPGQSSR